MTEKGVNIMDKNIKYLRELDAETLKEELICFLEEEGLEKFTDSFTDYICEDLSLGNTEIDNR